jgi:hypothetical protein
MTFPKILYRRYPIPVPSLAKYQVQTTKNNKTVFLTGRDIAQAFSIALQGITNTSSARTESSIVRSFLNSKSMTRKRASYKLLE